MQEETTVLSNEQAGAGFRRLRLAAHGIASAAVPGQFVHVRVPGLDEGAMRRPISICDADAATGVLTLFFKIVGRGTEALARVSASDRVDLVGPLGNGFPKSEERREKSEERRAKSEERKAKSEERGAKREEGSELGEDVLLVGGGYGVAPLYFLARRVIASGRKAPILFVGGRTSADVLLLDEFAALGVEIHAATQDGSLGTPGLVTAPLDAWLSSRISVPPSSPSSSQSPGNSQLSIPNSRLSSKLSLCACGPAPMLRALDERAATFKFPAWLSLDRRMACGIGACLGCVQRVRGADGGERWARVCVEGPVFPSGTIVWD